ncbi:hypothetical protein BKA70DRAFT_828422 [Coprinopsis sp. MPI-PUGE-AT-0042]|nr:hypothetical protein BKA70DRAFT_828422 [Coprinopsis sp. MPI-PUGE-AT-0042]
MVFVLLNRSPIAEGQTQLAPPPTLTPVPILFIERRQAIEISFAISSEVSVMTDFPSLQPPQASESAIESEPVTSKAVESSETATPPLTDTALDSLIPSLESQNSSASASATSQATEVVDQPDNSSATEQSGEASVPVGVAVGAALGALVAGVLIVVIILCVWNKKRYRAKLSGLEATSDCHPESGSGPITPFDRFENAAAADLAFIQKGMAEDQRRNLATLSVATEFPSEKRRLATASTCDLPVLDIHPLPSERSNASLMTSPL